MASCSANTAMGGSNRRMPIGPVRWRSTTCSGSTGAPFASPFPEQATLDLVARGASSVPEHCFGYDAGRVRYRPDLPLRAG